MSSGSSRSIFSRASVYANLSPAERALLRFLGVLLTGALLAGAQAVMPLLASANPLNLSSVPWASVIHTFLTAAVIAVASGISKYHAAQGDPPLPAPSSPVPSSPIAALISTEPPASTLTTSSAPSGVV